MGRFDVEVGRGSKQKSSATVSFVVIYHRTITQGRGITLTMRLPALFSFLFLLLSPTIHAAVLAIDYGAEFTKLSLVKPGVPLDVVLDRDSKRKVQSVVGWKKDDRVFGQEGKMAVSSTCRGNLTKNV